MTYISSPKKHYKDRKKSDYYAGFSADFVGDIFDHLNIQKGNVVLDPWNGYGTTTSVSQLKGIKSFGFDINPVAIIVAKSRTSIHRNQKNDLISKIKRDYKKYDFHNQDLSNDTLNIFFKPSTSKFIRGITSILEKQFDFTMELARTNPDKISTEGCIALSCLFRVIKKYSLKLKSSNPVWIKIPKENSHREGFSNKNSILNSFLSELALQLERAISKPKNAKPTFILTNMESATNRNVKADFVITSPPYLTRVDYVVATYIELSILNLSMHNIQQLRKKMTGTPCINSENNHHNMPMYCRRLIQKISKHKSYSSNNYYKKFFIQYFHSMNSSLRHIDKNLKETGKIVFVVQDSFYKDIPIKLDWILNSYAKELGWILESKVKFLAKNNMVNVNTKSSQYRDSNKTYEYILIFEKQRFN